MDDNKLVQRGQNMTIYYNGTMKNLRIVDKKEREVLKAKYDKDGIEGILGDFGIKSEKEDKKTSLTSKKKIVVAAEEKPVKVVEKPKSGGYSGSER